MLDLTNRKGIFYWQTDRNLSGEDYVRFFLKRHEAPEKELLSILLSGISSLPTIKTIKLEPIDPNVLKGNVNVVRKIIINDKPYVVRMHPKGIKNGYFYVEKIAQSLAAIQGVPVPRVLEVHEATSANDMDFSLVTREKGETMDIYLQKYPKKEQNLLFFCGVLMAKIHKICVFGFGPFSNQKAKHDGKLIGFHRTYKNFIHTGLSENLDRLIRYNIIKREQADRMGSIFEKNNFEPIDKPRLIHNDFADWNLLTDGNRITSVLDWDECHGGDPIADLACWSTFFDIERMKSFLNGYKTISSLPGDYERRFHFYRLRYTISKMALRIKRYQVDKTASIAERLRVGKRALEEETSWFHI